MTPPKKRKEKKKYKERHSYKIIVPKPLLDMCYRWGQEKQT